MQNAYKFNTNYANPTSIIIYATSSSFHYTFKLHVGQLMAIDGLELDSFKKYPKIFKGLVVAVFKIEKYALPELYEYLSVKKWVPKISLHQEIQSILPRHTWATKICLAHDYQTEKNKHNKY